MIIAHVKEYLENELRDIDGKLEELNLLLAEKAEIEAKIQAIGDADFFTAKAEKIHALLDEEPPCPTLLPEDTAVTAEEVPDCTIADETII